MLKIAMVVPPISDLNTLYASAPRLTGWLRRLGHRVDMVDLGLELLLRVFSRSGLERLFAAVSPRDIRGESDDVYINRERYLGVIDEVIAFLQGGDPMMANRIIRGDLLPEGPSFREEAAQVRRAKFGRWGKGDLARHMATLMLQDLTELFQQTISPHLGMVQYAEKLGESQPSFEPFAAELARPPNLVEAMMFEAAASTIAEDIDLVCLTCPFPGMMLGSLLVGRWLAAHRPSAERALGGGFPSTELRRLSDPRLFDCVDYVVLDDGEGPLAQICARVEARRSGRPAGDIPLDHTFTREAGEIVWHERPDADRPRFRDLPAPDYGGYRMDRYIKPIFAGLNPINRLLNEGPWLKLMAAHGCYWKRCTFCDIHLDYINDFDPLSAPKLADQMDAMHAQTGLTGFHFTDEAAPPPLLVNLAIELLRRERSYQWWGNIRYDPGFTPDRARLLAAGGMIAVTGGIEIASDELLPRMDKGISVFQVTKVLQAFTDAGIITHAYLIFGFPGETLQDTVNSLEILRQLCAAKLLQSGFYHRFSLTAHSPVGRNPELFGLRVKGPRFAGFSNYNMEYEHVSGGPDRRLLKYVQRAVNAFTIGEKLDRDVRAHFEDIAMPEPTVAPDFVRAAMAAPHPELKIEPRLCWLGGVPRWSQGLLDVSCADGAIYTTRAPRWVADNIVRCRPASWGPAAPPRPDDLSPADWFAPLRARGMVLV